MPLEFCFTTPNGNIKSHDRGIQEYRVMERFQLTTLLTMGILSNEQNSGAGPQALSTEQMPNRIKIDGYATVDIRTCAAIQPINFHWCASLLCRWKNSNTIFSYSSTPYISYVLTYI
jgi:hypothetical protein